MALLLAFGGAMGYFAGKSIESGAQIFGSSLKSSADVASKALNEFRADASVMTQKEGDAVIRLAESTTAASIRGEAAAQTLATAINNFPAGLNDPLRNAIHEVTI